MILAQNKHIDQCNRTAWNKRTQPQSPDLQERCQNYDGINTASSTSGAGKTGNPHIENLNYFSPCRQHNSKLFKT
jgi:hypothetical protein